MDADWIQKSQFRVQYFVNKVLKFLNPQKSGDLL